MNEIELRHTIPVETRTLIEMSARIDQLRQRAEAAEKELAELKARVQPLVDVLRETLSVCEEMQAVAWLPESDVNSKIFDDLAEQCDAALKQWDNSQNRPADTRFNDTISTQITSPSLDGGPAS